MSRYLHALTVLLLIVVFLTACGQAPAPTLAVAESTLAPARPTANAATPAIPTAPASSTGYPMTQATPVVAPHVMRRQPTGLYLGDRRPAIQLKFDHAMNAESVAAALRVDPLVQFKLVWEDETQVSIEALEPLTPGARYHFTLAKTAMDERGIQLNSDYQWDYYTKPTLASLSAPTTSAPHLPLALHFNYPMSTRSVEQALIIRPPITGTFRWDDQRMAVTLTPFTRLPNNTTYTIAFGNSLRDERGDELPPPNPLTFTTLSPILSISPENGLASPAAIVKVTFDRLMDHASTEAAFQIEPEVEGAFEWRETTLSFMPASGYLDEHTVYTVTISPAALGANQEPIMGEAYHWSFRTGQLEAVASFGAGANAQVVDADGRRAVQFITWHAEAHAVAFELYRLTLEQFLDRYSSDFRGVAGYEKKPISTQGASLAAAWQAEVSREIETEWGNWLDEAIIPADVPPGLYILNLTAGPQVNDQLILVLTRNVITVKQAEGQLIAWVSDINGHAIPGIEVGVYARNGQLISQGQADGDGVYRARVARDPQPLIVVARAGEDVTAAGLSNEWQSPTGYWGDWWRPAPRAGKYAMHIYTDRPIYRPGQTVYFKVIIRKDDDALLSIPLVNSTVTIRLRDARNNVVRTIYLPTSEFGTVSSLFRIAEGAMLGSYNLEITLDGESHRQVFKVQDYRKPDYEVKVTTDAAGYVTGDEIRVNVDADYFFGEPVPNAQVTVKRYELGQNYCREACESEYTWYDTGRPVTASRGRTDSSGHFAFTVSAEMGSYARNWGWWSDVQQATWGIEVTVDDGSRQTVSSFAIVKVFNAAEQIRVETGGYLKTPGEPFEVQASARTIFDQPVSGRHLTLQLRRWNSYSGDYTTVVQAETLVTGEDGRAAAVTTVAEPGFYQVHLTGYDRRGNETRHDNWLYVFSEAARWEAQSNNDLKISADRDQYAPGDVAQLIIESSFSGPALLTFERGTTRREQLVNLAAPLTRVEAPIQRDDAPNIYVTVNAWKEQDTSALDKNTYASLADSRLRTAKVNLHVPVTDKTLTITLTPDKPTYAPRETATFTVRVTDMRGEPVSAEVSLALVDEAIFSLSDELSGPIFDAFYFERANIVRTYDSMALWRYMFAEDGGRGGGGGDGAGLGNPRSNFPDTAKWIASLLTDANGEAVAAIPLPDNLTSWRLTAKAVTADTQVGETHVNVTTQQDIIVRPLLPRALTAGDRVELSAIVHNYSESQGEIVVGLQVTLLQVNSAATQTVTLAPGEQRIVGWTATAVEAGEAQVIVWAESAGGRDAVKLPLPIQPLAIPDVETKIGEFTGEFSTGVVWPSDALGLSTVKIELSRSIAGSMMNGLEYLTGYPYGCVEQTMSKALPNAVVGRAFHQLGLGNLTLQADLPPKINASLQRLYGFQHNDGGWGWWFDDATDAYQTAWVVFGLAMTQEAGYEVDSGVIRRGVDWLAANLQTPYPAVDIRTRAFALYAMSVAGYGDLDSTRALVKQAGQLDTFSRAALALALHTLGATEDASQMLDLLATTALTSEGKVYWPDAAADGHYREKTMSSTMRSTALALDAFVHINPSHALEPGIVRYLMSQRRVDGWGSTNETAFTLIALTDHILARDAQRAAANTNYRVELGGQVIAAGTLGRGEPAVSLEIPASQLNNGINTLKLNQSGGGQLYYIVSSRVYRPQAAVQAAGNVQVFRQYLDARTSQPISATVAPGQLVKVQLSVVMPDDGFYVMVEDRLPGGLEALNEGLNTTSHESSAYHYCYAYECYDPVYRWQEYGYNSKEVRGDRVSFFITQLSAGRHTFTYYARATRAGTFVAMPVEVSAMYDLTVWGRSSSSVLVIP